MDRCDGVAFEPTPGTRHPRAKQTPLQVASSETRPSRYRVFPRQGMQLLFPQLPTFNFVPLHRSPLRHETTFSNSKISRALARSALPCLAAEVFSSLTPLTPRFAIFLLSHPHLRPCAQVLPQSSLDTPTRRPSPQLIFIEPASAASPGGKRLYQTRSERSACACTSAKKTRPIKR